MFNPLEIRVALNATTNQGLAAYQELAGQNYKQLQDLKQTHQTSLVNDSKVFESKEGQAANFKSIENPGEESPRKEELWQKHKEKKRENKRNTYEPVDFLNKKNVSEDISELGLILNFSK